ncbi:IS110 family RNA-guided transposase [Enterococcus faecium]|uniref:IS110 family transposase n=1 Tax=Enterococcus faecium TaxID=1352 RepID=UPI000CFB5584|nr:IS110 family transposase [Enterococcus faecium]QKL18784.1 IS110 family transposase [Enterococcus faecium]
MTLFVGIDVTKNKHDFSVIDSFGTIHLNHKQVKNDREGFTDLQITLESLRKSTNEASIQIALEDTGHYCFNLIRFLRSCGYPTFSYNPIIIREFAKVDSLRKTKTDKSDALTIAKKLLNDLDPSIHEVDPFYQELKFLTRHRSRTTEKRAQLKTQFVRLLDIMFPELAPIVGKANIHSQYIYNMFKAYPSPKKISRCRNKNLFKVLTNHRGRQLTSETIDRIKEASKQTIGFSTTSLELELLQIIETIELYTTQIATIDTETDLLMAKINSPITSITGVKNRLGSVILSEIRNIHNFKSSGQLLAFACLEPSVFQSGQYNREGHMVKRGSTSLRWALIQAAKLAARFSPTFKAYLDKKRAEGKHYSVAITHVAKKLVRVIFHLLKHQIFFEEVKLN